LPSLPRPGFCPEFPLIALFKIARPLLGPPSPYFELMMVHRSKFDSVSEPRFSFRKRDRRVIGRIELQITIRIS
jgi:hypothetical protein